jgi:hypothetical protein
MQWIMDAVTKHTGRTDAAEVATIVDIMSDHVHTFNGLAAREFKRLALEAMKMHDYLKTPHGQDCWKALCMKYDVELAPCAS